ncbi:uncharacterized protein LY89DRAFT_786389 [Mollisia scopiformis]|uniref:DUF7708 domain-containing protein n=1 Tax=Mollisia scopiformis TaxID=149040 RepID=A0A194WU28_MOLSC|nr:uncharacterized protein LY89DRAFT_786389 [Mollisia scopiformis]KUJ11461.1 hypothetical protein LY89DRAFT_786389 [Mollisia scopiformis]
MTTSQDDAENLYLVRRYSEIVRDEMSDEPLSQGLAAKVDADIEREKKGKFLAEDAVMNLLGDDAINTKFYESICATKLLDLESKSLELQTTWVKFSTKLKLVDDSKVAATSKPDMNIVRSAIYSAQSKIQKDQSSKVGKVKAFFTKSIQCLDDHNYLFDLLPSGDKYTSVFTGAFSAIVKATATHEKIANEISDSLDEISDQVRSFFFAVSLHPRSMYIKYHIALFYYELFGFLISVMREWYQSSWTRFSKSFGSSFLETTVQGTLKTLSQYTQRVKDEDARMTRELNTRQLMALGTIMQSTFKAQVKMKKDIDRKFNEFSLQSNRLMGPPPLPASKLQAFEGTKDVAPEDVVSLIAAAPKWTRDSIMRDVEAFRPYLQAAEDVDKLVELGRSIDVNTDISATVHRWITSDRSEALWIEGPSGTSLPSQSTLISAFILGNLRRVEIPAMVDFCQYDPKHWRTWNAEKEFLKMTYAFIYQAAKVLPERLEPELVERDFSTARFQKLNENVSSLPEAIHLLADLITVGPRLQFCIVDGLQLFGGRNLSGLVRKSLKDFVTILCEAVAKASGGERIIKVLFTTDGIVGELADSARARLLTRQTFYDEDEDELLAINDEDLVK